MPQILSELDMFVIFGVSRCYSHVQVRKTHCVCGSFLLFSLSFPHLSQGKKSPQQQISDLLEDADDGFGDIWNSYEFLEIFIGEPNAQEKSYNIPSRSLTVRP